MLTADPAGDLRDAEDPQSSESTPKEMQGRTHDTLSNGVSRELDIFMVPKEPTGERAGT